MSLQCALKMTISDREWMMNGIWEVGPATAKARSFRVTIRSADESKTPWIRDSHAHHQTPYAFRRHADKRFLLLRSMLPFCVILPLRLSRSCIVRKWLAHHNRMSIPDRSIPSSKILPQSDPPLLIWASETFDGKLRPEWIEIAQFHNGSQ